MEQKIILRPSAASRWIACPASVKLSVGIPEQPSGEAAQIGTAIHALAELCFKAKSSPADYVGKTVEGITMTQTNAEYAQLHLDEIKRVHDELGHVRVEQYVTIVDTDEVKLGGTADVVGLGSGKLIVSDLKTGKGWVDADSPQLKIYALGAIRSAAKNGIPPPGQIELRIVQPHHGDVRSHSMTYSELFDWYQNTLRPAIHASTDAASQPTPSDSACQYCPAKVVCPAQRKGFEVLAAKPDLRTLDKEQIQAVMVSLSVEQIADLLERAPVVEKFIDAVRDHAVQRIRNGESIHGWQMVPKRATRKWTNEDAALQALTDAGIDKSKLVLTEMVTPAVAEKLLGKDKKSIVDDLTTKESTGLTLGRAVEFAQ
jgi:hypothetical protein